MVIDPELSICYFKPKLESLLTSPSRSQAVVCVSTPRKYPRSGYFLVINYANSKKSKPIEISKHGYKKRDKRTDVQFLNKNFAVIKISIYSDAHRRVQTAVMMVQT